MPIAAPEAAPIAAPEAAVAEPPAPKPTRSRAKKPPAKAAVAEPSVSAAPPPRIDADVEAANEGAREFTKVLRTLTEMMRDRGYDTDGPLGDRDALLRTYGDGAMFSVMLSGSSGSGGTERPPMRIVFFPHVTGLKMEHIRKAYDGPSDYCLVVHSSDKFKPNVAGAAAEIEKKLAPTGHHLQMFTMKELEANIMHHILQPRFFRMSEAEVAKLMADLSMTHEKALRGMLPRIHDDDKVARYMGLRPGNIVRIVRDTPTSGELDTYRICVPAPV